MQKEGSGPGAANVIAVRNRTTRKMGVILEPHARCTVVEPGGAAHVRYTGNPAESLIEIVVYNDDLMIALDVDCNADYTDEFDEAPGGDTNQ